eukprot:747969-Hanusia_phi.AAC.2
MQRSDELPVPFKSSRAILVRPSEVVVRSLQAPKRPAAAVHRELLNACWSCVDRTCGVEAVTVTVAVSLRN